MDVNTLKEVLLQFGEKVALGIGILAILSVAILGRDTKIEKKQTEIKKLIQEIEEGLIPPSVLFKRYDVDKDGNFTRKDVKRLKSDPKLGRRIEKEFAQYCREYDKDKNKTISLDEWLDGKLKRTPIPSYLEQVQEPWRYKYHPLFEKFASNYVITKEHLSKFKSADFVDAFMMFAEKGQTKDGAAKEAKITFARAPFLFMAKGNLKLDENDDKILTRKELSRKYADEFVNWFMLMDTNHDNVIQWNEAQQFLQTDQFKVSSKLIYQLPTYKFIDVVPPEFEWISAPRNLKIKVSLDKFELTWQKPVAPLETSGKKKGKPKKLTSIDGYVLIKSWHDKDTHQTRKEQKILRDCEDIMTYTDEDLVTRVTYTYKVQAFSKNAKAQGGQKVDITIDGQQQTVVVSDFTNSVQGMLLPQFKLALKGVSGGGNRLIAYIEVQKYEKGEWLKHDFFVRQGEFIGRKLYDRKLGHYVDYNTAYKLIEIRNNVTKTRKVARKKFDHFDPKTKTAVYTKVEREMTYKTAEIVYQDENGKKMVLEKR